MSSLDGLDLAGTRVLTFCDYFAPASSGGAERVTAEVLSRLAAAGAHVSLLSACPPSLMTDEPAAAFEVRRVEATDLRRVVGAQLALAPLLGRAARDVVTEFQPNVLYAHGLHFQGSVVAARVASRTGLPLVTTAHLGSPDELSLPIRVATSLYERSVARYILSKSRDVVAVSQAVAEHLESLGVAKSKITVIPNGVDHDRFDAPGRGMRSGPVTVALIGRLIANKGPQVFLEALRLLLDCDADWNAVVIGDGPLRRSLEEFSAAAGISERVEFTGHVDDVAERLRAIDILVRPSQTEGLPLAVLEAMAARACVVASAVPGNMELIGQNERGRLFPVGDAVGCADAIHDVIVNRTERARLAEAGHQHSLRFSWDHCALEVGRLLLSALRS